MSLASRAVDRALRLTLPELIVVGVILLVSDQAIIGIGSNQLLVGSVDGIAHLMTGVLVLAALPRPRGRAFAVGLLAGSVLVDLDHIPKLLGFDWISQGTPRPYGHSLLTLVILAVLVCTWRTRRPLLFGALVGVVAHFGRDLGDQASGMPLFWPFSDSAYNVPHWIYLAAMGVVGAIALIRTRQGGYATRSPTSSEEPAPAALGT